MARYVTYYPGEILQQQTFNNHLYMWPGRNTNIRVLEEGNPRVNGYTKAWVRIQIIPQERDYWTYKRFYRRANPVVAYKADQEADASDDLL